MLIYFSNFLTLNKNIISYLLFNNESLPQFSAYMTVGCLLYETMPLFVPVFMDFIFPLNDNRSHDKLWILGGEYLINKHDYYYELYFFEAVCSLPSVFMFLGVDAMYIGCIHHCVALIGVLK